MPRIHLSDDSSDNVPGQRHPPRKSTHQLKLLTGVMSDHRSFPISPSDSLYWLPAVFFAPFFAADSLHVATDSGLDHRNIVEVHVK